MRRLLAETLRASGYSVTEAPDGRRLPIALARDCGSPAKGTFDIVVTDLRMPFYSGMQVLEKLRSSHWNLPVVLMTAFSDDATRARSSKLGATLLDKPFAMADLFCAIDLLLRTCA
jgi:DNA-binding response OmpR family regulator